VVKLNFVIMKAVFRIRIRIRIRRILVLLGLLDPDPIHLSEVRPDPFSSSKNSKKNLDPTVL
jgi:hypothetical protein